MSGKSPSRSDQHSWHRNRYLTIISSLLLAATLAHAGSSHHQSLQSTAEALASYVGLRNGWSPNLTKLSGLSFEDAKIRHVLAYEVGLTVRGKQREFSLSEEVTPWEYLIPALPLAPPETGDQATDQPGASSAKGTASQTSPSPGSLPGPPAQAKSKAVEEQGLALLEGRGEAEQQAPLSRGPSLPPFVLEGPVQLWIEGVTQLRLAMPHDVDAGDVKKVVLAAGAAVTITGCQELSLARPLQIPTPLKPPAETEKATGGGMHGPLSLFDLAAKLRKAAFLSGSKQMLALRIVKPTSIIAAAPTAQALPGASPHDGAVVPLTAAGTSLVPRMRVRRLSASSVELQLREKESAGVKPLEDSSSQLALTAMSSPGVEGGHGRISLWPFAFHNASHAKLSGFEEALLAALGDAAFRKGTFQLTRARATMRKLVSVPFEVELQSTQHVNLTTMLLGTQEEGGQDDGGDAGPDAAGRKRREARPLARQHWEVLLQEGRAGDLQPVQLKQLDTVQPSVIVNGGALLSNFSGIEPPTVPRPLGLSL